MQMCVLFSLAMGVWNGYFNFGSVCCIGSGFLFFGTALVVE